MMEHDTAVYMNGEWEMLFGFYCLGLKIWVLFI